MQGTPVPQVFTSGVWTGRTNGVNILVVFPLSCARSPSLALLKHLYPEALEFREKRNCGALSGAEYVRVLDIMLRGYREGSLLLGHSDAFHILYSVNSYFYVSSQSSFQISATRSCEKPLGRLVLTY